MHACHGRTSHLGALLWQRDWTLCLDDRLNGDRPLGAAVSGVPGHDQPVEAVVTTSADPGILAVPVAERVDAALEDRARAGHRVEVLPGAGGLVRDQEPAPIQQELAPRVARRSSNA